MVQAILAWAKPKIQNFLKEPIDYAKFEKILDKSGRTPEAAMAIQVTALAHQTLEFTALEDGEQQKNTLRKDAENNRDFAAEQLKSFQEKAKSLRKQADKAEKTGEQRYKDLNHEADNQQKEADGIEQTLALLPQQQ